MTASPTNPHYPAEWGPGDARRLTCSCGNTDPAHVRREAFERWVRSLDVRRQWAIPFADFRRIPKSFTVYACPVTQGAWLAWNYIADTVDKRVAGAAMAAL